MARACRSSPCRRRRRSRRSRSRPRRPQKPRPAPHRAAGVPADLLPNAESVAQHVAAFERELAAAASPRDAQSIRDRYLGRKNSVTASWMQLIASAPPDQKKNIGRYANELKQAIEARWTQYGEHAAATARPAGAVDVTLPGRLPALGHRHPLTVVRDRLEEIFTRMG
ncbi:MAG: hypothetical protein DMG03_09110, partial [Acidobacteria bacterium]